jgi:hypothetical protein
MALSQLVAETYSVSLQKSGFMIMTFFSLHLAAMFVQEKNPKWENFTTCVSFELGDMLSVYQDGHETHANRKMYR